MKRKKRKNKQNLLVLFLVLFVSIGFAVLTRHFHIFGSTILKGGTMIDVRFENVRVAKDSVNIQQPEIRNDNTEVYFKVLLTKPGDFLEFTVDAKNYGKVDAMVQTFNDITLYDSKTEEPVEVPDYMDISVTYNDGAEILEKHLLPSKARVTYKVRIEYKFDIDESQIEENNRDFKAKFDITFEEADEDAILTNFEYDQNLSALSKEKLQQAFYENFVSMGWESTPYQLIFVDTGVENPDDSMYIDVSENQDKSILAWMDNQTMYISARDAGSYVKAPEDSSNLFSNGTELITMADVSKLDVSNVTNMKGMFAYMGRGLSYNGSFEIVGLKDWDTSNVTDMSSMFKGNDISYMSTWSIDDISGWNTSQVRDMSYMFSGAGGSVPNFELDLSEWKTGNVENMSSMFEMCAQRASSWTIGDISNWDVSKVKDMSSMFNVAGQEAYTWSIGDLSTWNTSSVTNMNFTFRCIGENATIKLDLSDWDVSNVENMGAMLAYSGFKASTWSVGDLSEWKTGNVTNMFLLFGSAGNKASSWSVGDLSEWDTSNVTDMGSMFSGAGENARTFNIGDISGWNIGKVTNMSSMFMNAGYEATTFNFGDITKWDTSNITDMGYMFSYTGYKATNFKLDLSGWNVDKVSRHDYFNRGVTDKVTPPNWVK